VSGACGDSNLLVLIYHGTMVHMTEDPKLLVERVQTGVRMEKRLLKVLKAFAEYHDMTLGDLLEGIVLHAFDGKTPFSSASLERIQELKRFYQFDLDSSASHRLKEIKSRPPRKRSADK
jgi:predicted DNA-binding ribbon-helix-helix protein